MIFTARRYKAAAMLSDDSAASVIADAICCSEHGEVMLMEHIRIFQRIAHLLPLHALLAVGGGADRPPTYLMMRDSGADMVALHGPAESAVGTAYETSLMAEGR